ncbi:hypothetical protein CHRY9390_02698 [Chryseobacterium aquaeductus]|uniref:Uncharacterized protein n=1 Tax=Chryseobacterium aquaeductus TaxID=2675056 RepID=A0A9N8QT22_9FLAO|nr:hypothetical protein [Chryseobacterium aquaeductus]CAA7331977.1 hypothetical protein CHRY9390_02698 [Chryseobacterium potabilaquae]CAD7813704.1 hypothetical protein CHRY9390_02698 [Chryseobacterium aquaeductus]
MENLQSPNVPKIEAFMEKWFQHFDQLDDNSFFLQYLAEDVKMKFPGADLFVRHEGFSNWFTESKNNLLGNTTHHVSDVEITETADNEFDIVFKVRYVAEIKDNKIDMDVKEDWKLTWDKAKSQPIISEYIVS